MNYSGEMLNLKRNNMEHTQDELLQHEIINQFDEDLTHKDYESMSYMLEQLIELEEAKKILIDYLGDEHKERWIERKTTRRW